MNHLAAACSILSEGIPFFQAGEEMLRSKPDGKGGFEHNSFKSSDAVNSFKWDDLNKDEYQTSVEYYRGLLELRKAHPMLRMNSASQVNSVIHPIQKRNPHMLVFQLMGTMPEETSEEMYVVFNAGDISQKLNLPAGKWHVYVKGSKAGTKVLETVEKTVTVPPVSALVVAKDKNPGMTPVDVVAALVWDEKKFMICQRPEGKPADFCGNLWAANGNPVKHSSKPWSGNATRNWVSP